MHALVTTDGFIGECEAGHETGLLQPEYGCKRAREEYSFDGGKSDQRFRECRSLVVDPPKSPVSLALDARDCINSVEQIFALSGVFNVGINEEGIRFRVNVFHHYLKAVEAPGLGGLYFIRKALKEVLVYDPVRSSEKGEDVRNEVAFIVVETVGPVMKIL